MFSRFANVRGPHIDDGATAVEYAIMASAIAAVIIGIVYLIGAQVLEYFDRFYQLYIIQ